MKKNHFEELKKSLKDVKDFQDGKLKLTPIKRKKIMNEVRNLIEKIPFISGCQNPERFSERNIMVFDKEMRDTESVFAFKESDKTENRLAVLEIPPEFVDNSRLYRTAMDRLKISMLSYDKSKGRITAEREKELDFLIYSAESTPIQEVDEILPLEVAVQGVWF